MPSINYKLAFRTLVLFQSSDAKEYDLRESLASCSLNVFTGINIIYDSTLSKLFTKYTNVFENRTYEANRKNIVITLTTMTHVQTEGLPTPYTLRRSRVYLSLRGIPPEVRE